MKNLDCWPFLVSRNLTLDYRTIVAPDFMCEVGAASILAEIVGGSLTAEKVAFYLEIHKSKVGRLTIVFRVIETTLEDMEIEGSGVLKDEYGREILLREGIVIKGLVPDVIVTKDALEIAHRMIIQPYREFWEYRRVKPATASVCFSLSQDSSESCLQYEKLEPYGIDIPQPPPTPEPQPTKIADRPQVPVSPVVEPQKKSSKSQEWRSQRTNYFDGEVRSVTFLPKRNSIAIRYEHQQTIIVSDFETNQNTYFTKEGIIGFYPNPIAISPNGQYMASVIIKKFGDGVIKLWNLEQKKEHKEIDGDKNIKFSRITPVAFTPDSEILISGSQDKTIFFWDVKSGYRRGEPIKELASEIMAIAVSPDEYSYIFVIGDGEGRIQSWNLNSRIKIKSFPAQGSSNKLPINSLAFSPDGKILVSGGDDFSIKLWEVDSGKELKIGKHSARVRTVAFSPDGKLIASGDDSGIIKIWNVKIWDVKTTMENVLLGRHDSAVTSLAFSPDGKTLASGSKDKTVRFWEKL